MKKVSIYSLASNLKLETRGTFKFFNCSFVGLADKNYDVNWDKIPKFKSVHLNKNTLKRYKNTNEIFNYLSVKYGYPEKHLQFILDCKDGKYV